MTAPRLPATTPEFGGGRATIPPAAPPTTEPAPNNAAHYLSFEPDGSVTVHAGKAEVGQNVRTSLAQAVADELRLPFERVRVLLADTSRVPFDRGTFGSRSTPDMVPRLRRAAAAAREALIERAAERWEADTSALVVRDGGVVHAETGQVLSFVELAPEQRLDAPFDDATATTPAVHWTVAGTSAPKPSARDMVTGAHRYASDVSLAGMLYGRVLRPPAYGAHLASVDLSAAQAMSGVVALHEGDFAGVAAPTAHGAARALAMLRAQWTPPAERASDWDLYDALKHEAGETEGGRQLAERSRHEAGSLPDTLRRAKQVLRATYTNAYIAHAPLEPRAAVAEWTDADGGGRLTVWTGTQRPFGVHAELVTAFGLRESGVRVIVPDTGSGYGGKHTGEAALEAARLARAAGKPVKVVWTREEEFSWAYLRPAGLMELTAGLDERGRLIAWEHHCYNAGGASLRTPYDVANQVSEFHHSRSPLRQGSYRALAATANSFARESFMDELAHAAGIDPLEFRRAHLPAGRLRDVLEAAAERFGWLSTAPDAPGKVRDLALRRGASGDVQRGIGLACSTEKGSYVATCAEIEVIGGAIRVLRAVTAFECGAVISPDHLRNQVEGAVVQGLGGALMEAIRFADGRLTNPRFSEYRVPRFGDLPQLETVLLNRTDLPSAGAGETPIIAIAPAIANALFNATGERRRAMPLSP